MFILSPWQRARTQGRFSWGAALLLDAISNVKLPEDATAKIWELKAIRDVMGATFDGAEGRVSADGKI